MKKIISFIVTFLIVVFLFAIGVVSYIFIQAQAVDKADSDNEKRIEVPYGSSVKSIAAELKAENLIKNERLFYIVARRPDLLSYLYPKFLFPDVKTPVDFVLRSGIYRINPSMNLAEILELLSSGNQEYESVSIPEGYTITKIGNLLESKDICQSSDFKSVCFDKDFLSSFNIPSESAEGFLFPDTYFFNQDSEAVAVATQMVSNFFAKIASILDVTVYSPSDLFDIVTLASIVEREYRVAEEAPLIASVFKNRLNQNIGLYSCATVEYIITEIQGKPHPTRILIEDTKIDNPYNTYKWAGLPPGPISNPGLTALDAVVHSPETNYYFFQVKDAASGTHVFTSTFDEHIEYHNLNTKK